MKHRAENQVEFQLVNKSFKSLGKNETNKQMAVILYCEKVRLNAANKISYLIKRSRLIPGNSAFTKQQLEPPVRKFTIL